MPTSTIAVYVPFPPTSAKAILSKSTHAQKKHYINDFSCKKGKTGDYPLISKSSPNEMENEEPQMLKLNHCWGFYPANFLSRVQKIQGVEWAEPLQTGNCINECSPLLRPPCKQKISRWRSRRTFFLDLLILPMQGVSDKSGMPYLQPEMECPFYYLVPLQME